MEIFNQHSGKPSSSFWQREQANKINSFFLLLSLGRPKWIFPLLHRLHPSGSYVILSSKKKWFVSENWDVVDWGAPFFYYFYCFSLRERFTRILKLFCRLRRSSSRSASVTFRLRSTSFPFRRLMNGKLNEMENIFSSLSSIVFSGFAMENRRLNSSNRSVKYPFLTYEMYFRNVSISYVELVRRMLGEKRG